MFVIIVIFVYRGNSPMTSSLSCVSTRNIGDHANFALLCSSLWVSSAFCFCYVVSPQRHPFGRPWCPFTRLLGSRPLLWPWPPAALALLKRHSSLSGTFNTFVLRFEATKTNVIVESQQIIGVCSDFFLSYNVAVLMTLLFLKRSQI